MNFEAASGEASESNEEHAILLWGKDDPRYKVAESMVELCSTIEQKVEPGSDELEYLTIIFSKQIVKDVACFNLDAYDI